MKTQTSLVAFLMLLGTSVIAQSVEDGKKFIYYERYQSAKDVLAPIVSSNPKNSEAVYWLGQAYIGLEDIASAKKTYQEGLQNDGSSELLLAGMGQIELMEGKLADARSRFETAISLSKGRDIDVLHAVGRANVYAKQGDARYAIEKLEQAASAKKFNDPSVYVTMGDAYKKLVDGGNAVLSYKKALSIDPKYAAARYKEGKIYETQRNWVYTVPAYEEAQQMDPNYAPAYFALYAYYFYRDVRKAEEYFQKYVANTDRTENLRYDEIDVMFLREKYNEAISTAKALISSKGGAVKPRLYRLMAYSYVKLNDYKNALSGSQTFFDRAKTEDIVPKDYELRGNIYANISGEETKAFDYYKKAIEADTIPENDAAYQQEGSDLAKKLNDKIAEATWTEITYKLKKEPNKVDLYYLGRDFLDAGWNERADSVFKIYIEKYPEEPYGYYFSGRALWAIDTSAAEGLAIPPFEKFVEVANASQDSTQWASQKKVAYTYFIRHYVEVKDYPMAAEYCRKYLWIDPENEQITNTLKELERVIGNNSGSTNNTGSKKQGNGNGPKRAPDKP